MSDTGTFGYGQQTPYDTAHPLNAISFIIRQMMARMDTMKLVQVVAVTGGGGAIAAAGTVDVQLLVNQVDGNFNATPHGVVHGIPWWRLQGGPNAIIADPQVNDIGYVVVSDRDISSVKANKAQANPGSRRKHDVADGVYVGGCLNGAPTQYVAFTSSGIKIVDLNGNMISLSSSGITITGNVTVTGTLTADKLETGEAGLAVTGNISATGTITAGQGGADQVGLQTHEHPTAAAGAPSPPTPGT